MSETEEEQEIFDGYAINAAKNVLNNVVAKVERDLKKWRVQQAGVKVAPCSCSTFNFLHHCSFCKLGVQECWCTTYLGHAILGKRILDSLFWECPKCEGVSILVRG